jgi:FKBP-type peptidyl-prolyl cis-trans isomerase FkpA
MTSRWFICRSSLALLAATVLGCTGATTQTAEAPIPQAPPTASAAAPGKSDPDAPKEFTETSTGLRYKVLRKGSGPKPTPENRVTVNYRGWLDSGQEFDSSYKRGEPITFALREVVPGWTEGLTHVNKGGMIELEIPSDLGYGPQGSPPTIPPNARLHFTVELIDIQ